MSVRRIILFALGTLLVLAVCAAVIFGAVKDSDPEKETFTLWQLPSVADDHGNSYIIRTPHGRVVAIDGGKGAEITCAAFWRRWATRSMCGSLPTRITTMWRP